MALNNGEIASPHGSGRRLDSRTLAGIIRQSVLQMVYRSQASHVGSCFSCADILAVLYADVLQYNPAEKDWPLRDRFLLSKGHAAAALYAVLAECGFFPKNWLDTYCENGSLLTGHASHYVPGVEHSTGSLGHALPVACGLALAGKRRQQSHHVYCLLSDGECDEGSNWEAFLFAPHHQLNNLTVIVDANGIQSFGRCADVLNKEPFADKLLAFGWDVRELDGHDHASLRMNLSGAVAGTRPRFILARTVKGKGVSFMEDTLEWHYRSPRDQEWEQARRELATQT